MKNIIYILLFCMSVVSCQSQTKKSESNRIVGGPCEGCEAIFEYGQKILTSTDTLPDFQNNEPKLKITGTVYKKDGKTPASNVILYIYHTNREGIYETKGNEKNWGKRHGFIRGWTKTDEIGQYTFFTFRPAAYPNRLEPEHIHMTIKESDKNEYYIDDIMFNDDSKLTNSIKQNLRNRAGSGIVELKVEDKILIAKRNIILGLNIPDYD
ncbi:dioxygenase family protein [Ulvibacter antarcticus]|uniref:Protocatechuate 3,4-dioxygenase beta subunit n=1 Tax=Ulvibacter antarcticus TaxID=442714 RepID=A0A3L9Y6G1_9FLAO|nr:intradiol ring-cleavage dioxygenase [Ulvibacter antarcticus]RMA56293.1 protocatechuate 3,4-dioxygenase beta subunit [Ulvibacter antarcticus]